MQARMSSAVMEYSLWRVSKLSPPASALRITVIGVRVPRITGLPWQIFGSMTMCSFMFLFLPKAILVLLLSVLQQRQHLIQFLDRPFQLCDGIGRQLLR